MNADLPNYGPAKQTVVDTGKPVDPVARSVEKDNAFSKPGHTSKGKGWQPAKGTRFRPTNEKAPGRKRKRPMDPRRVQFY